MSPGIRSVHGSTRFGGGRFREVMLEIADRGTQGQRAVQGTRTRPFISTMLGRRVRRRRGSAGIRGVAVHSSHADEPVLVVPGACPREPGRVGLRCKGR